MIDQRLRVFWLLPLLAVMVACREASPLTPHVFKITDPVAPLIIGLSDSATPLAEYLGEAYPSATDLPGLQILTGNDQTLLDQLAVGELHAAIVYQQPEGDIYRSIPIAMDGLVIGTHPGIQLNSIGLQTLQTLYSGTVNNWSIFDQPDVPITLFGREQGSGARTLFDARVLDGSRPSSEMLIAVNESDMIRQIMEVPGSLGYGMMASSDGFRAMPIDGIKSSPETVTDGSYPLSVQLFLVTIGEPSGDLELLDSILLSEEWQAIIGEKYGQLR